MTKEKPRKPKLDSDDIEGMAIRQIETFFERSSMVKTYLEKTDKGPFWDGYLHIYKNATKTNENFIGAIKVQSKGKTVASFAKDKFSYPIRRVDLEAYKKEGTLYFVTQITETGKKLFYRELTPSLISNILRAHKGVEKPSVLMYVVPDDLKLVEQRLYVFKKDCEKQITAVTTNAKAYSMEELASRGIKKFTFTVPYKPVTETSLAEYLSSNEVYLYADIDPDHHTIVPIGGAPVRMNFIKSVEEDVSVGGKVYYHEYKNELTRDSIIIHIGDIVDITFPKDNDLKKAKIHYHKKATCLQGIIKEAEFILDICKNGSLKIGTQTVYVRDKKGPRLYEEMLPRWKELDAVLNMLGLQTDIDMENLSDEDGHKLDILVEMVGKGKRVKLEGLGSCIVKFEVSNIYILLWCHADESDGCMMGNFFDGTSVKCKFTEGQYLPSSIFSYLTIEQWSKVDNICYSKQLDSYKEHFVDNPYITQMANRDCLNMLHALDSIDRDSNKFEKTANNIREVLEWLKEKDAANSVTYTLNLMQLNKRLGVFTEDDTKWLRDVVENEELEPIEKAEASVLLDDYTTCMNQMKLFNSELSETFYRDPVSKWFTEEITMYLQQAIKESNIRL